MGMLLITLKPPAGLLHAGKGGNIILDFFLSWGKLAYATATRTWSGYFSWPRSHMALIPSFAEHLWEFTAFSSPPRPPVFPLSYRALNKKSKIKQQFKDKAPKCQVDLVLNTSKISSICFIPSRKNSSRL